MICAVFVVLKMTEQQLVACKKLLRSALISAQNDVPVSSVASELTCYTCFLCCDGNHTRSRN